MTDSQARAIFRYSVPVDAQWHTFDLSGPIVHVDCRRSEEVEFWTLNEPTATPTSRAFRVFGTGHPIPPAAASFVGTALTPGVAPFSERGGLVWHLMEHAAVSA